MSSPTLREDIRSLLDLLDDSRFKEREHFRKVLTSVYREVMLVQDEYNALNVRYHEMLSARLRPARSAAEYIRKLEQRKQSVERARSELAVVPGEPKPRNLLRRFLGLFGL